MPFAPDTFYPPLSSPSSGKDKFRDSQEKDKAGVCWYCSKVTSGETIDVVVETWLPSDGIGTSFTKNAVGEITSHEKRRVKAYKKAHDEFIPQAEEKGTRVLQCGKICRKKKGDAKKELKAYLSDLRTTARDAYDTYAQVMQRKIDIENMNWLDVNDVKEGQKKFILHDHFDPSKIYKFTDKPQKNVKWPTCPSKK